MSNPPSIPKGPSYRPPKLASIDWDLKRPPSPYRFVSCIYTIQLMGPARPFRIRKFVDTDLDGTMEIGQTKDLATKIWHFKGSVLGTSNCDTEGLTLGYIHDHSKWMRDRFGSKEDLLNSIQFTYVKTGVNFLLDSECRAIDHYCSLYGEPPVLNGQVPGVARKPDSGRRDIIGGPYVKCSQDRGQMRPGIAWLTAFPPSPLTDLSCNYSVHLMDRNDPSKPFPIHRPAKTDPEGTLVIGRTRDLAHRLSDIRYAILGKIRKGEWGLFHHIYDICPLLKKVHGPREDIINYLLVRYIKTKPSLLASGEIQAFNKYISIYADLPPMNSQIPGDIRYNRR